MSSSLNNKKPDLTNLHAICEESVQELHQLFVAWFQGSEPREALTASLLDCLAPDFSHVAPNGQFLQGRHILIGHLQDKYGCYKNRLFQIEIYDVRLLWHDPQGRQCLCTYEEWQSWLPDTTTTPSGNGNSGGGGATATTTSVTTLVASNKKNNNNKQSPRRNGGVSESVGQGEDDDDDEEDDEQADDDDDDDDEEVHQFGRLSTCLLERKANDALAPASSSSYRWIHVHETWLEAESPQNDQYQPAPPLGEQQQEQPGLVGDDPPGVGGFRRNSSEYMEDETILTGPVEYDRMMMTQNTVSAVSLPNNAATASLSDDDDDDGDDDDDMKVELPPGGLPPPETLPPDEDEDNQVRGVKAMALVVGTNSRPGMEQSDLEDDDDDDDDDDVVIDESNNPIDADENDQVDTGDDENMDENDNNDDDEEDEDADSGDRHLLMLMSTQSLSREQMTRQNKARDALEQLAIAFYELDGANPNERENRNSLFQLSGKWGQYPQFFLVNTAGTTTFWGTWEQFWNSHTNGNLAQDIALAAKSGGPVTTTTTTTNTTTTSTTSAAATNTTPAASAAESSTTPNSTTTTAAVPSTTSVNGDNKDNGMVLLSSSTPSSSVPADATPVKPPSLPARVPNHAHLLILISSQTLSSEQSQRQEQVSRILQNLGISFETIDGSIKSNRERRNQLFRISTFWGKYPQFFHHYNEKNGQDLGQPPKSKTLPPQEQPQQSSHLQPPSASSSSVSESETNTTTTTTIAATTTTTSNTTFWGRWEEFEISHQRNTLMEDLQYIRPLSAGEALYIRNHPSSSTNALSTTATTTTTTSSSDSATGTAVGAPSTAAAIPAAVLLLVSNQSLSNEQMSRQDRTRTILQQAKINYQELDGASRDHRQHRNELFKISKLWGRYPQIFVNQQQQKQQQQQVKPQQPPPSTTSTATTTTTMTAVLGDGKPPTVVFFGDWEKIESSHTKGTLVAEIQALSGVGKEALSSTPSSQDLSVVATTTTTTTTTTNKSSPSSTRRKPQTAVQFKSPEDEFLEKASGILLFEEDEDNDPSSSNSSKALVQTADNSNKPHGVDEKKQEEESMNEEKFKQIAAAVSPIPQDVSSKRHVSSKLLKHAKPLTWENTLVGLSLQGFDIGTSQGPIADETWYKEVTDALESISQCPRTVKNKKMTVSQQQPPVRRKITLPEMVFPTAHVALEGHGFWLSWDVLDAMEDWARAHAEIPVNSNESHKGVSVLQSKDAKLWESKKAALLLQAVENNHNSGSTTNSNAAGSTASSSAASAVFHYDWTYSTPFVGKMEGGEWVELDESGMRVELLTDMTIPILFFDEVTLFEDDLHDNGHVQFTVKIRVMPSCAYVLARLWLRVDQVVVRVRETRLLVDFFGLGPAVYRDVTWRECYWDSFKVHKLPTDVRAWQYDGKETPAWQALIRQIPEVEPAEGIMKFAALEPTSPSRQIVKQLNSSVAEALTSENSLEYFHA